MNFPSLRFLLDAFLKALVRFPLSLLSAASTVIALWILIGEAENNDQWGRLALVGVLGISMNIALTVISEVNNLNNKIRLGLQAASLLALAALWHWFPDLNAPDIEYRGMPQYAAGLVLLHLLIAVVPFVGRGSIRDFWVFNRTLLTNIISGAIFSAVLFIGLCLALLSVNELFDLHLDPRIYARLFVFVVGMFNTVYFLFHFPENYNSGETETGYHTILVNLCRYILVPVVVLYFVILYAYSFKIVINQELPRGWVSSLILGFSVAGIFTYLLNYYLNKDQSTALTRLFHQWFWPVLLPMTVLLFIAVNRRTSDYGFTETRFLVAHLGVWLSVSCLYFIISKKDDIRFIPGSLVIFGLLWIPGAGLFSDYSQKSRLLHALQTSGRMENGMIRPALTPVDSTTLGQLRGAVEYFAERGNLKILDPVLPMPADSITQGGGAGIFLKWLGSPEQEAFRSDLVNFYLGGGPPSVDVRGYSHLTFVNLEEPYDACSDTSALHNCFTLNQSKDFILWKKPVNGTHTIVDSFSLAPLMNQWNSLYRQDDKDEIELENRRVTLKGSQKQIGVLVTNAMLAKGDSLVLDSGQLYLMFNNN